MDSYEARHYESRTRAVARQGAATSRLADAHTRQADALERIATALECLMPSAPEGSDQ